MLRSKKNIQMRIKNHKKLSTFAPEFNAPDIFRKENYKMSKVQIFKKIFSVFLLVASFYVSFAQEEATKKEKFNAGEMIMHHVQDAHSWHIMGHISVPLPVILYSKKGGLELFSSAVFMDDAHEPNKIYHSEKSGYDYKLIHEHLKIVNASGTEDEAAMKSAGIIDFSITKNVFALLFGAGLMCWIFLSVAKSYKRREGKAPKGLQSLIEPLIIFVRDDVAKTSIGPKYEKFMPFLLTVFFFIWINNLLGLVPFIPGGANLTGSISITLVLAGLTFIITIINGNGHYWRHIFAMPGVPIGVLAILTPIEILGVFLRPFVLMVRLFANITAGHIIALAFLSLIFIFGEMSAGAGFGVSILSLAFGVFMMVMELLVAFLQAYVFTLLSAMYFGSAVEEGHHAEEAHAH
jgi:F-type H+-transporting ATPase subunit a